MEVKCLMMAWVRCGSCHSCHDGEERKILHGSGRTISLRQVQVVARVKLEIFHCSLCFRTTRPPLLFTTNKIIFSGCSLVELDNSKGRFLHSQLFSADEIVSVENLMLTPLQNCPILQHLGSSFFWYPRGEKRALFFWSVGSQGARLDKPSHSPRNFDQPRWFRWKLSLLVTLSQNGRVS
jgi:hypothetical protein